MAAASVNRNNRVVSRAAAAQLRMNKLVRAMATQASRRILETDTPCIVQMQEMLRGKEGVLSLAQGIVHWPPPPQALAAARAAADDPASCLYCADDGLPELRAALKQKLERENGLVASEVMVTAGANQVTTAPPSAQHALPHRPLLPEHLPPLPTAAGLHQRSPGAAGRRRRGAALPSVLLQPPHGSADDGFCKGACATRLNA
eukprot:scaffold6354_cov126-Isochrysis_galbana.AAC.9